MFALPKADGIESDLASGGGSTGAGDVSAGAGATAGESSGLLISAQSSET
jgi:hypothetical protein